MRPGERRVRLISDARGVAYVEFLLAFLPIFMFFMGMLQMAVLYGASLLVEHAADRAARAAATMLDDDPRYYAGDARGRLDGAPLDPASLVDLYARHALRSERAGGVPLSRAASITAVAALPLLVLTPRSRSTSPAGIADSLLRRLEVHAHAPGTWDTETPLVEVTTREVEIRVRFRYACAIPVGGRLVCGASGEHLFVARARRAVHRADYPYPTSEAR